MEAWEAAAYPGVAEEAPATTREFLEMRSPASPLTDSAGDADNLSIGSGTGGVGAKGDGGGGGYRSEDGDDIGERLVVYPARNGHASYHAPRRYVPGLCVVRTGYGVGRRFPNQGEAEVGQGLCRNAAHWLPALTSGGSIEAEGESRLHPHATADPRRS